MSVTFRPAVREDVGLLIGIAGPSGSGKTYSAMRLAAGMSAGKRFAVIDTEAGRSKHYADRFAFDHADLQPPFRSSTYTDAIKAADEAGYPVIVVDSVSHEHAGEGGMLDWHEEELDRIAGNDGKRREACKMTAWIKPKGAHKRLVSRLLQVRAHIILCFRAEQKVDIVTVNGRTEVQPKRLASGFSDWIPICDKNMLYELTASFLLTPEHPGIAKPIKLEQQHRELLNLAAPLDEQAGEKLAAWAKGGEAPRTEPEHVEHESSHQPAPEPLETTAFVWRLGKWKGTPIDSVDEGYLDWFAKNGKVEDHKQAAQQELDRRMGQAVILEEEGYEEEPQGE